MRNRKWFPYYIVRFKLSIEKMNNIEKYSFPYYIVRFKHQCKISVAEIHKSFPYYIVRFKHAHGEFFFFIIIHSFHTT